MRRCNAAQVLGGGRRGRGMKDIVKSGGKDW